MNDIDSPYNDDFEEEPAGGPGGNRNFVIAIITIIVIFVAVVAGVGGYLVLSRDNPDMPIAGTAAAYIAPRSTDTAVALVQDGATLPASQLVEASTLTPIPEEATTTTVVEEATTAPEAQAAEATQAETTLVEETQAADEGATAEPTITQTIFVPTGTSEIDGVGGELAADLSGAPAKTATISALLTKAVMENTAEAEANIAMGITPTVLPQTGFMDEVGLPILGGLAALFVVVIFMTRRLRASNHR